MLPALHCSLPVPYLENTWLRFKTLFYIDIDNTRTIFFGVSNQRNKLFVVVGLKTAQLGPVLAG